MQSPDEKIYTVTALTRLIKYTLEESFPSIWVEGEISNYIHHSSGHRYLSLKDENATIKLTIWRSVGKYLKFEPEDGMKVRAFGDISLYEKGGNYQLNVKKLIPVGVGELEIAFRQLYEKLSAEGLFDLSRKKPIPLYPMKVGIITSPTGAAIRDIIQIARRRNDLVQLILYPAQVQGKGAELSIITGIDYFNQREDIDVIIAGRGGGSLEDLWVFNEEALVRAIAGSRKPIATGIGHEVDTTLSDLASDLRAPTPSAAAELVIWDKQAYISGLHEYLERLSHGFSSLLEVKKGELNLLISRPIFRCPENIILSRVQYLDNLERRFATVGKILFEKQKNGLSLALSRLESLSPLAILKRGYAVVKSFPAGLTVKSISAISKDDMIEALLSDGSLLARVESTSNNKEMK